MARRTEKHIDVKAFPALKRKNPLVDTSVIYCGDCLDKLREIPAESVDLIYIDPPFNSNRNYEVFWGETQETRSFDDRHSSTAAYIDFMRPRCEQLRRVLKPTGSFYYHCDWHAGHYVKVMLDQIFGESNFINEIIWKRQSAHNDAKQGSKHLGRVHETLLLYANGGDYCFKHLYTPYTEDYLRSSYGNVDPDGKRWKSSDLTGPGGAAKGNPQYEFLGVTRFWRFSKDNMERLWAEGKIHSHAPARYRE